MFGLTKQQAPFTIQIEPTEGCNLGCSFCGLRGMREKGTKPWNFMSVETGIRIAEEIRRIGWKSKIVFGMHGEPTLNPRFLDIVREMRRILPKTVFHIFTNSHGILHDEKYSPLEYLVEMKKAGINNLILDSYSESGDSSKIVDIVGSESVEILRAGVPLFTNNQKFRILFVPPITEDKINHATRKLANHSGAAFPPDYSYNNKRCTMPFRELSFRWDGNVAICCDDFRGRYPIGNIADMTIDEIWNHPRFQAARILLYAYDRNFEPCSGCTNISTRVGFLPDSSGKEDLTVTKDVLEKARAFANNVSKENEPLSVIVKRSWEK